MPFKIFYLAAPFILFIVCVSTAHAALPAPGGIDSSLQMWLYSDAGLTSPVNGGSLDSWADQSGNGRDVFKAAIGKEPTYNAPTTVSAFNFHPSIGFLRASNQFFESVSVDTLASDNAYTLFEVFQITSTSSSQNLLGAGEAAGTWAITMTATEDRTKVFHNATQLAGTVKVHGLMPGITATRYDGGGGASFISNNGIYKTLASTATYVGGTTVEVGNWHGGANSFGGSIAEVAIYNRSLSALEVQKIHSSLSLKYGITYRGWDYVSSAGVTYFSTTTNVGYVQEIFGLGKDTDAGVDQKISSSEGTSSILILATTQDFTSSNADGGRTSLSEGTFMMVGHNGTSTTFGSRYDGEANTRMNRIWKVQETGTVGTVYVAIPNTITFPSGTPKVIVSTDTVFNHLDTVVDLTDSGTYYYAQINPSDGQYISFGAAESGLIDCTNYDNALRSACATTIYSSQYDTDLATGNWPSPLGESGTATYTAHNATELATYEDALVAGDILELADGTWNEAINLEFDADGTALNPITIRPQTPGGVTFTNAIQLSFIGDHIRFEGFKFEGSYVHPNTGVLINNINIGRTGRPCDHCLIHNVSFDGYNPTVSSERTHRIRSAGQWNRIASSTFSGKTDSGVEIVLFDNQIASSLDYLLIDGNYFSERVEDLANGLEALRLGDSTVSFTESRSYVIGNLFEDYTGEVELVSLKKDNIVVRNNTFINSGHTPVVMRTSEGSVVEANIVDGEYVESSGGVRISGDGHSVVHNIFERLVKKTGSSLYAPLQLYQGEDTLDSAGYRPVTDLVYAFNTLYNNLNQAYSATEPSGLTTPVWPTGVSYYFNAVSSTSTTAGYTVDGSSHITFAHNVFDGETLGLSDTSGFDLITDPEITNHSGVYYSDASTFDYTIKPYRAYYAEMGIATSTLFKMQYVNSAPETAITLHMLTSAEVGAHYTDPVSEEEEDSTPAAGGGGGVMGGGSLSLGFVNNPSHTLGTSTTGSLATVLLTSYLTETQIQSILSLLSSFGADQEVIDKVNLSLRGQVAPPNSSKSAKFTRNLKLNDTGNDVRLLQQYLNAHGFLLANSGPGSVGHETTLFGDATQYQLIQFQKAHNIAPASGYFGPITRVYVEAHE